MLVAQISDLHLGRKSPGDPHGAERLNTYRQTVVTLVGYNPDALVIAGDTFDGPQVDQAVIEEAAKCLSRARNDRGEPIPVVIIPGNHDPADADKLWSVFKRALPADMIVHLPLAPEVIELADKKLLVEAYPCQTRFSAQPPWENRLPVGKVADGAVRLVVAHGTLQGGPVPEGETDAYPFTQSDLDALGADYVALGHFHGLYPVWIDGDECRRSFCYSGTHEPDQFGGDAGYAVLATVIKGEVPCLRRLKVGRRHWCQVPLAGPADVRQLEDLRRHVETSGDPGRFVIRIKLVGRTAWAAKEIEQLDRLEAGLRAVGTQVERRGDVSARVDVRTLDLHELPSGAIQEALLSLQAELLETTDENQREILAAAVQIGWDKVQEPLA